MDPHDLVGHAGRPRYGGCGDVRQPWVQGDVAAVVADLEDVVNVHAFGVDLGGPVGEIGDEVLDLLAGGEGDDLAAAVDQLRQIQRHLVTRHDVGEHR